MTLKHNRCPFCQGKMVLNANRYRCIKCGYSISGSGMVEERKPNRNVNKTWIVVVVATIIGVGLVTGIRRCIFEQISTIYYDYEDYVDSEELTKNRMEEYDTQEEQDSYLPESELFQRFVSEAFQKDYTQVTKEEYASITCIRLGNDYDITYSIHDGEEKQICFGEYLGENMEDLKCFPGLKKLDISNETCIMRKEYMENLSELEEIGMKESPEVLAGLIEHKEKIRSITIGDDFLIDSLEGIEDFQNLEELYIKTSQIEDLSFLSSLERMETLVIEDGRQISNFGTLSSLKNLKKLSITAESLKNIDFIKEMTQLEDVTICRSAIKTIEPLRIHKDKLKQLTLLENYEVTDYRLLDEFTGLEEASLGFDYDAALPGFVGMTNIKKLLVDDAEDIAFIANASNVTELTLTDCELEHLDALKQLKKLKILHINDAGSYTKNLSPLMELTQLEVLDISETYIYGYVEELLSLPNLQEFCMDECRVAFDFNKLTGNESLLKLSMNEVEVLDYGAEYNPEEYYSNGEGTVLTISDYPEAFQKFPNLTELYMKNAGLENVEFARGLSGLEVLDISDNYVSSVEPLKELGNLKVLFCGENDIMDLHALGEHVKIIEE